MFSNPFVGTESTSDVPRVVWSLWLQGREAAPPVVQACLRSWELLNPGWKVVVLDEGTARDHVDVAGIVGRNARSLERPMISDIIRINLLARYGGVWADATCLCVQPLDEWLPDYASSGFFAFERPGADRMISNWFLASAPGSPLTTAYRDAVNSFWRDHEFVGRAPRRVDRAVRRLAKLMRSDDYIPRMWQSVSKSRWLQRYPYYCFHYLFPSILARSPEAREVWSNTPRLDASGPHRILRHGLLAPMSEELRRVIGERRDPLYKLGWKFRPENRFPGCTLDYLLDSDMAMGAR